MNDETKTTDETTDAADAADATAAKLEDVGKEYFPPSKLEDAQASIDRAIEACAAENAIVRYNFDPERTTEPPEGYGVGIQRIAKKAAKRGEKRTSLGVAIAFLPDLALAADDPRGEAVLRQVWFDSCMRDVMNAVRPKDDGSTGESVPYSLDDFLTTGRAATAKVWRAIGPGALKMLKDTKRLPASVDIGSFQKVLSKAAFAAAYPATAKVPQTTWMKILDSLAARARNAGMSPEVFLGWKETRHLADDEADFDPDALLEGLDDLESIDDEQ